MMTTLNGCIILLAGTVGWHATKLCANHQSELLNTKRGTYWYMTGGLEHNQRLGVPLCPHHCKKDYINISGPFCGAPSN